MSGQREQKTFTIVTLGCKLNQYESECLRERLEKRHWIYRRFEEGASFYIINSCTVTGKTDARTRNFIRRARRTTPGATIIVTGCYAEIQPEILRSMNEVDLVLGNDEKPGIPEIMNGIVGGEDPAPDPAREPTPNTRIDYHLIGSFFDHSRAFIKIQEGCNASCSYCIIPAARGRSRSVPASFVVEQVRHLEQRGFEEVVLTGIHIGRYGFDLENGKNLTGLVDDLLSVTNHVRLRLSSIEVTEVTDGLISLICETERLAPHLHIPLQSGDDGILAAMNRPYRASFFRQTIENLKSRIPTMAIGTDIIVGFPGEGEEHYRNTYRFVRELPFSYFHVFNFSRRPGTRASTMPDQIPPEVRKRRSAKLIKLGNSKRRTFMKSNVGIEGHGLVQGPQSAFSRFSRALTGNYCEVFIRCPSRFTGKIVPIAITHYSSGRLYGNMVEPDVSCERAFFRENPQ
jgi:threonylcarbamoyladenosine tRNA methylthiotransferase MtaB